MAVKGLSEDINKLLPVKKIYKIWSFWNIREKILFQGFWIVNNRFFYCISWMIQEEVCVVTVLSATISLKTAAGSSCICYPLLFWKHA